MTLKDALLDIYARNLGMLKMLLADISDPELLTRPTPGANHAAWQLGHLVTFELSVIAALLPAGKAPSVPPALAAKYDKSQTSNDDPAAFEGKQLLLDLLTRGRSALIDWLKSADDSALSQPSPDAIRPYAPTVSHALLLLPMHVAMHTGQIQVLRRKLNKPVLF